MTINLLASTHMPTAWTNLLPWNNLTNQQPYAFHTAIRVPGEPLASAGSYEVPGSGYQGPDDPPVKTHVTVVPECVHKHYRQLPPDERPGGDNALILEGEWVYNVFAAAGAFSVDVVAWVLAPANGTLEISVPVNVHYNPRPGGDGSPGAAVWRLCLDDEAAQWRTFQHGFEDREYTTEAAFAHVLAGEVTALRLQLDGRSDAGVDFFTDLEAWRADFTPDSLPPEGEDVDYVVVVNLLPQDATVAEKTHVVEQTHPQRQSILQSAHDAARLVAPGPPPSRVVVWDVDRWTDPLEPWLLDRGVNLVTHRTFSPSPPTPPPPDPPSPLPPKPYILRSNNLIGLQSGFTRAQSFPYIEQSGTTVQKFFNAGDAYVAARMAPGIVSVWRRYVGNEQGRIWQEPTIRLSALWYLDLYTAEIETARANMGLTLDQFLAPGLVIESLNETIPTFNTPVLEDAVEFDVHLSDLAHRRYGDRIKVSLLCGAIGNPHESEVPKLLPAAKQAAKWEEFLGYHCYWTDNEHPNDPSFLEQHWPYHAGRWMEWDTYFRSQGVYPRYISGEIGTVYAHDGVSFNSGKGWKSCGSFVHYLKHIDRFNTLCLAWNKQHQNRFAGGTIFGYGNWQWNNFELNDGDVILLTAWANNAPAPTGTAAPQCGSSALTAYITALELYLTEVPIITTAHQLLLSNSLKLAKAKQAAR